MLYYRLKLFQPTKTKKPFTLALDVQARSFLLFHLRPFPSCANFQTPLSSSLKTFVSNLVPFQINIQKKLFFTCILSFPPPPLPAAEHPEPHGNRNLSKNKTQLRRSHEPNGPLRGEYERHGKHLHVQTLRYRYKQSAF